MDKDNHHNLPDLWVEPAPRAKEPSRWRRFVAAVLPRVTEKWELADRALEAKVAIDEAEALKRRMEAYKTLQEANQIGATKVPIDASSQFLDSEIDGAKLPDIVEREVAELRQRLTHLERTYGTTIKLEVLPPGDGSGDVSCLSD
jgi:hypothetical protein